MELLISMKFFAFVSSRLSCGGVDNDLIYFAHLLILFIVLPFRLKSYYLDLRSSIYFLEIFMASFHALY